ncbi:MAG: hypothetical protein UW35_C0047G0007 [Candidatus Collierbacteria bacterium GW2011_GWF2_44_15]|uniref:Uncharacterized protein n=4 Tax=Candidatus Collieribacteriota TaxID=1752725 RepID=A0A0G1HCM0_9BACT|nr:MAG: hypothetical protein UW23_C0013G0003 [Candidatus Collierbacteria bacterium GW2011_GWA1_44_12]KKT36986.1 MAG: hypothetical protein UW26_C0040G0011 [Candidatus Collierbacteria bacterium GW2011_GWF1_44_12]KKT44595.1 MAG: hypothetical protein UW35_C0047G0007 [Candidatus Collierbacteria bacterium GW2011_GWF2_44_15]KKU27444.1 MAG: hypothetical protein UX41_C0052G0004 [Candidatus Collierbacteria bacterium GW2011_GWE1_46_18]
MRNILRLLTWPVIVGYRSLEDVGDFIPFGVGLFLTFIIVGGAISQSVVFSSYFLLIALLAYLICAPLFYRTGKSENSWEFPYSMICNAAAGIIWMILLSALFFYWPVLITLIF